MQAPRFFISTTWNFFTFLTLDSKGNFNSRTGHNWTNTLNKFKFWSNIYVYVCLWADWDTSCDDAMVPPSVNTHFPIANVIPWHSLSFSLISLKGYFVFAFKLRGNKTVGILGTQHLWEFDRRKKLSLIFDRVNMDGVLIRDNTF